MRILVTGGAGFIGANLAHRLSQDEENEVTIIDDLSREGSRINLAWMKNQERIKFIKGDICDSKEIEKACKETDIIFHTAGQVAVTTSIKNPREDFITNIQGSFNVLEATRKSGNDPIVFFTSTNKVYGSLKNISIKELETRYEFSELTDGIPSDYPLNPCTPYGCSKCAADIYMLDYHRTYGLKTVVFRMSCIYGIHQFGTVDQGWISYFIQSHISGEPITIFGDGKQVRDLLYVDDLFDAFMSAWKKISTTAGEAYAIGGGALNTISILELVSLLEKKYDKKFDISFSGWRSGDQKVYYSNTVKAKRDFEWQPKVSVEEGIHRLYSWFSSNCKE